MTIGVESIIDVILVFVSVWYCFLAIPDIIMHTFDYLDASYSWNGIAENGNITVNDVIIADWIMTIS